jgi:CRISPR-associated protein Csb2
MLTVGIRYLQGVAVGSHGEHGRVEWPPHPARVFMAMAAAHYQTGAAPAEREALEWLEKQCAPEIYAPEAEPCRVVTQFVPVNDKAGPAKAQMHSLPLTRHRIDRTFARASLAGDTVMLCWRNAEPSQPVRQALAALCAKVTRVGHSSSLVQMWVADGIVGARLQQWVEDEERGTHQFRVPREGTLKNVLDFSFNDAAVARYCELLLAVEDAETPKTRKAAKQALAAEFPHGEPRQDRPRISTYASYALMEEVADEARVSGSVFSPHLAIFTLERMEAAYRWLDLACTLALMDRWREALAKHAAELAVSPEALSLLTGHSPRDKSPLQSAHVAFLPLGFVGHANATGHLPGIALAFPREMPAGVRQEVLRAAGQIHELKLGRLGVWRLAPSTMVRPLETLRAARWTAHPTGTTQWSSVTPIAYDQHPKAKDKAGYLAEVAAMISAGCERIGLPRPRTVIPTPVSAHLGAPPAHIFPRLRRKDDSERRHTHAILVFDQPVVGPVIVGAGRYRGYGFFRPLEVVYE